MRPNPVSGSQEVPWYHRPIFASAMKDFFIPPTAKNINTFYNAFAPYQKPVARFIANRTPVEIGGFFAVVLGGLSYLASLIGLDRIAKWGGIALAAVGIGAVGTGSFLARKYRAPENSTIEPENNPRPGNRREPPEKDYVPPGTH
jgi:hypothetical protein